ncbi:hypothetical protein K227x_00850 [Rubripirellula lacrimiformis]|uniref:Uncharacterized protein n=1 Tax=Rubripirellula lacrimiformis TaxID=1930273 RepID=A0A517N3Z4_9BACT|nr:hypothetical protein [Rubripirellula lacrimiformis]QDT01718.1 hypothetical protein K227x_00850 [Rubripirellula lacrimiformis]
MSEPTTQPNDLPGGSRWRLWVDGCGGFLLLVGNEFSLGRAGTRKHLLPHSDVDSTVDIGVHADWPRKAGTIYRQAGDYFWEAEPSGRAKSADAETDRVVKGGGGVARTLISDGKLLGIDGSASVKLAKPSPLSTTAVLSVAPPHRFDGHVDAVVLVDRTVVMGAGRDCHLRHRDASQMVVLVYRPSGWVGKVGLDGEWLELRAGRPTSMGSITMTLESA